MEANSIPCVDGRERKDERMRWRGRKGRKEKIREGMSRRKKNKVGAKEGYKKEA